MLRRSRTESEILYVDEVADYYCGHITLFHVS
jgi:hypothetical protein